MTYKKLPSAVAIAISLELIMAPLPAIAQTSPLGNVMEAVNKGMGLYNTLRTPPPQQAPVNPHIQRDMNAFAQQKQPISDKVFNVENMKRIPGLMEYIAKTNQDASVSGGKMINPMWMECKNLPSTLNEPDNQVCRDQSVNPLIGDPRLQAEEAMLYYTQYKEIQKQYQNFSVSSQNVEQTYGLGCMKNAMKVLEGFFDYRSKQLDEVAKELDKKMAEFEAQSESDLMAIRESTAILGGEGSPFATEFAKSNIFDYGERLGDPACNSIMAKNDFDKMGKAKGLMSIDKKLKEDFSVVPPGSKYSLESYAKNHGEVVNDIRKMADKVAEQATLNFSQYADKPEGYTEFLNGVGSSVSSDTGVNQGLNKAFFSDVQTRFSQSRKKLTDQAQLISSEIGGKGGRAMSLLSDPDSDASFDAEIGTLENQIKNDCLNKTGIDTALAKMYDPQLSKQANKHTVDQISKRIKVVLENEKLSPEKKMSEIQAIENQSGSRLEIKADADYSSTEINKDGKVTSKTVSAASKIKPSGYFSDIIKNCETQFQVNKLGNKLTAKEAVKQLRTLKADYAKASRQHSKDIKDEIIKKMVDCGGSTSTANSTTEATCSAEKLNMAAPSFCAKAAQSCSVNMKQCTEKVHAVVKKLTKERLTRTNNYNNNVEAQRKSLVGIFDNALEKYTKEAESLRGMFGIGMGVPADIERDVKGDNLYDKAFLGNSGDAIKVKDPKQYLAMVKKNITALKMNVENQSEKIVGASGPLQSQIKLTEDNYSKEIMGKLDSHISSCLAAYNSYTAMMKGAAEEAKRGQSEMGEKSAEFCGRYSDIMVDHDLAGCKDSLGSLSDSMIKAAMKVGDRNTAAQASNMRHEMKQYCLAHKNEMTKDGETAATEPQKLCSLALRGDQNAKDAIVKTFGVGATPTDFCDAVNSGTGKFEKKCKDVTVSTGTTANPTSKIEKDCSLWGKSAAAIYDETVRPSSNRSSSNYNPPSTGVTSSFCNASNNSGSYNNKSNMGGRPPGQAPIPGAGAGWQ